jgi:hypothetical protein
MFIPPGMSRPISVKIFTHPEMKDGLWNVDNNHVVMSPSMYASLRDIKGDQVRQRKFFGSLRQVSKTLIVH